MKNGIVNGSARVSVPALVIGGIGIVRNLGEEGIPVYAGSDVSRNHILHSRYVTKRVVFTDFTSHTFVRELIELARSEGRKLMFFSDDDRAILTFAQHQEELRPWYYTNIPTAETVDAILDKRKFADLAQRLGLPVPWSMTPASMDELRANLDRVSYPCIIKPAHKEEWWTPRFREVFGAYRKAIECHSREELLDHYEKVLRVSPRPILQELVEGADSQLYSVNLYYDRDCTLKGFYAAHKLRTYPIHAGQGCLVQTVKDDSIMDLSREVARKLRINGLCNIQYKKNPQGVMKIMELHVRNSVWSYLGKASGMNLYYMAYLDQLGYEYPYPHGYQAGVKFVDIKRDLKALHSYRKTGEWTIMSGLRSLRGKRVYHIFNWKDPLPFIADTWYEILDRTERKTNPRAEESGAGLPATAEGDPR
jgi:predicted ATP-grasp superfamily ATP-dependent carboligase